MFLFFKVGQKAIAADVWGHIISGICFKNSMRENYRLPLISLCVGGFRKATLSPSLSLNSAPHLPNSELSLVEAVRHSPLTWLGQTTGLPSCSWKHEQMGWQEQRWLVCASFLGFVASVQSVTRGELFPFGPSARDQLLAAGNDQTHRLELDKPVLFYDGTFDSIFVSWNS